MAHRLSHFGSSGTGAPHPGVAPHAAGPGIGPLEPSGFQPSPVGAEAAPAVLLAVSLPAYPDAETSPEWRAQVQSMRTKRRVDLGSGLTLAVVLAVAFGAGAWAVFGGNTPHLTAHLATPPGQSPAALPAVVAAPPVTEAVDVTASHLGPAWAASDGAAGAEGLVPASWVTPCGALLTALVPPDMSAGPGVSRLLANDIKTGTPLWSVYFAALTGQADPRLTGSEPTYTTDCRMVLTTVDAAAADGSNIAVTSVDLATGRWSAVPADGLLACQAVGRHWAGCVFEGYAGRVGVHPVDLDAPNVPAPWYYSGDESYLRYGDLVIKDTIWTVDGYVDPATRQVVFGADAGVGDREAGVPMVAYAEARFPGGQRTGLVVRVAQIPAGDRTRCLIALWDPVRDAPVWEQPERTMCASFRTPSWLVVDQALIAISTGSWAEQGPKSTTTAYSLADGTPLWSWDGIPGRTGWDQQVSFDNRVTGGSGPYIWLIDDWKPRDPPRLVRVRDGAEIAMPEGAMAAGSLERVYALQGTPGALTLASYKLDPSQPGAEPEKTGEIPLGKAGSAWTFAEDGRMYVVLVEGTQVRVSELVG